MFQSIAMRHQPRRSDVWIHRLAWVTAGVTLPLLFIGGLVTSKGAALAVPDWPTTFGYNMLLYPWSEMVGGVLYEHSHRLVASGVGLLTVLLAASLWFFERRRWLGWLGATALFLVVVQGVIGGLRVILQEETLAVIHACFAQAFFALAVSLVLFTSREWTERAGQTLDAKVGSLRPLSVSLVAMIYLQGILGALLRHTGATFKLHLIAAGLIAFLVLWVGARMLKLEAAEPRLKRPAIALAGLLGLQLLLGLGSYLGKFLALLAPVAVVVLTTSHVVVGALMLATAVILALRAYRFSTPAEFWTSPSILSATATEGSQRTSS